MNTAGLAVAAFGLGAGGFLSYDHATSPTPLAKAAISRAATSMGYYGFGYNPGTPWRAAPTPAQAHRSFENAARAMGGPGAMGFGEGLATVGRTVLSPPSIPVTAGPVIPAVPLTRLTPPTVSLPAFHVPPPRINVPTIPQIRPAYVPPVVIRR